MHCLYLVATPIGNLEDITLRALRILGEAGLIAAEDTRKTRQMLKKYNISTPLISFNDHSKHAREEYILNHLEKFDVALVSEAGMPGISDPGYELVVKAVERGIRVLPVPGASAVTGAVAVSGLPTDRFCYLGFLPRKKKERRLALESVAFEPGSIVLFEAPHRLISSLNDIMAVLGDRRIAIAREMTKIYEEVFRGRVSQALEYFSAPKGEFTLVIEGCKEPEPSGLTDEDIRQLKEMKESGTGARDAVMRLTRRTGLSRRTVYQAWLDINSKD